MLFAILSVLSFTMQNLCCKEYGRRFPGTLYAQSAMIVASLAVVTAIMAALGGAHAIPVRGYILSAAFGVFFVLTLASMTLAMNCGHTGITLLIQNSSLVVPTLYGIFAWGEKLTLLKGIGILCILTLLALSSGDASAGDSTEWNRGRWLLFTALAFIGDSMLGVLQGMMSRECATVNSVTFTFWTSLFGLIIAAVLIPFCMPRKRGGELFRPNPWPFLISSAGIGLGTAGGNCFTITALTLLPGTVLFPLRQGSVVLIMWLCGILIYRDRVTRRGLLMLATGLIGLILLNL